LNIMHKTYFKDQSPAAVLTSKLELFIVQSC
jgi:hypothetical protein